MLDIMPSMLCEVSLLTPLEAHTLYPFYRFGEEGQEICMIL